MLSFFKLFFRRWAYRDAKSGHYVSKEYARRNPNTTVRERVR